MAVAETDKRAFVCLVGNLGYMLTITRSMAANNPGQEGLPGGHLLVGETLYQGAGRETVEETGLVVNFNVSLKRTVGKRTIIFVRAEDFLQPRHLKLDPLEVHSAQWMHINEVHQLEQEKTHRSLQLVREAYDERKFLALYEALG